LGQPWQRHQQQNALLATVHPDDYDILRRVIGKPNGNWDNILDFDRED
jgi:hypothetical protein